MKSGLLPLSDNESRVSRNIDDWNEGVIVEQMHTLIQPSHPHPNPPPKRRREPVSEYCELLMSIWQVY